MDNIWLTYRDAMVDQPQAVNLFRSDRNHLFAQDRKGVFPAASRLKHTYKNTLGNTPLKLIEKHRYKPAQRLSKRLEAGGN